MPNEFEKELAVLRGRVDALEAITAKKPFILLQIATPSSLLGKKILTFDSKQISINSGIVVQVNELAYFPDKVINEMEYEGEKYEDGIRYGQVRLINGETLIVSYPLEKFNISVAKGIQTYVDSVTASKAKIRLSIKTWLPNQDYSAVKVTPYSNSIISSPNEETEYFIVKPWNGPSFLTDLAGKDLI